MAGLMAYAMPNDLLFVKRFPVYSNHVFSEMAASLSHFTTCPSSLS